MSTSKIKIVQFITVLSLLTASSCASVNSVSLTPIPAQRSNVVKADVHKWIFLAFNFDNDFINPLVDDLKSQCPNGVVSGILTKDENYSYFLVNKKHVSATGFCSTATVKSSTVTSKKRNPSSTPEVLEN